MSPSQRRKAGTQDPPPAMMPRPAVTGPRRAVLLALGLALALAALLSYSNSFDVPFQFDDLNNIEQNPGIRKAWPPSFAMAASNRPFGTYTFALNFAAHGLRPWGYHATNLAIHVLAGLLLFGIVRRTVAREGQADELRASSTGLAFAAALLWIVHPLNTQAVTYIVQRLESGMALCYLATLYCFIRAQGSPRRIPWQAASIACCALGMGVKEVMVTAPVMIAWYHRAFLAPSWRAVFHDNRLYYAGLFSTWGVLAWSMFHARGPFDHGDIGRVEGLTPLKYLLSQAGVITHYLRLALWPDAAQCFDYGWPVARTAGEIVPPLLVVAALLAATAWAVVRRPAWGFLGAWFFVVLSPSSSVVPIVDLAFEHRMYLPLTAVVVAIACAANAAIDRLAARWNARAARIRAVKAALVAVAALQLAVLTWRRNEVYRTDLRLWEDTVARAPANPRGHYNLGKVLQRLERPGEAMARYGEAVRLKPEYAMARNNLGMVLDQMKRPDEAIAQYREAVRADPEYATAHVNLGRALRDLGRVDEGMEHIREALRLEPGNAEARFTMGNALLALGRAGEAVDEYRQSLGSRPDHAEAHHNLGNALQGLGQTEEALAHFQEAIRLKPDLPDARYNLGNALLVLGRFDEAATQYRETLRLEPGNARARVNLGNAFMGANRLDEAVEQYREALRLAPDNARAHANLASALDGLGRWDEAIGEWREALRLEPDFAQAHHLLGRALATQDRLAEAAEHLRAVLALEPGNTQAASDLARVEAAR